MQCPVCRDVQLVLSDRQGVEIDYCPRCRGVWLDRGELDKIIERADGDGDDHDRDRDRRRAYDDRRQSGEDVHKHHKRKSFWHELFD